MTKKQLADHTAERAKIPKSVAKIIVDLFFDGMREELAKGKKVEIRGFGIFSVRGHKGYTGRNPRYGNTVEVKPKRLPFFRAGKDLRERLNAS